MQGVQNVPGVDGEQSVQGAQGHINEEPPMGVYAMPHPIWYTLVYKTVLSRTKFQIL